MVSTAHCHPHQTIFLSIAYKLILEFELVSRVGMYFLVFEIGKYNFLAVGELYVVDPIADGELAAVLVSVEINHIYPTFALLHTSGQQTLICMQVLHITVCNTFESRTCNFILPYFHFRNLLDYVNNSSVIKDCHLCISKGDGCNFILKFAHLIDHLEFAIPDSAVSIIATCCKNLLLYREAEH